MPRAWRVKESHHGRSLKQKDTQRFFILLFPKKGFGHLPRSQLFDGCRQ